MLKRLVLCTLSAGLLGASLLAPAAFAGTSAQPNQPAYIVEVTGTVKGGFIETWSNDAVVYVPTLYKQRAKCARNAPDLSYCLGLVDGRMFEELVLKQALQARP